MASEPVNIFKYKEIAKEQSDQGSYDFIAGAATDEITLRRTRSVFDCVMMRPRIMVDVSDRNFCTTVLPIPTPNWPRSGLPEAVEAVDGRIEVYLDGVSRRGSDIFKALALGARALLIGRRSRGCSGA